MPTPPSPSPTTVSAANAQDASALHHLGDAVDADHLLAQAVAAVVLLLLPGDCDVALPWMSWCLELEAALAGRVGQRLHAAMEAITRAVERDRSRCRAPSPSRRCACRRRAAAARLPPFARSPRTSFSTVDALASTLSPVGRHDLRVDVQVRPVDDEPGRALLRRCASASGGRGGRELLSCLCSSWPRPYFFFVSLMLDLLADVANALALVRLGRAVRADLRGHLADRLLVDALDHDLGLHRRRAVTPFGIACTTGCEKPSDRLSLSPAACAR